MRVANFLRDTKKRLGALERAACSAKFAKTYEYLGISRETFYRRQSPLDKRGIASELALVYSERQQSLAVKT